MAPEQFHGKAVFASDLYSLGVTMYQMLTGALPYDTPAPADLDRLMSRRAGDAAAAEEPVDPEGDQRHRAEGAGAGRRRRATSARGSARRHAGARDRAQPRRTPPAVRDRAPGRRRVATTIRRTSTTPPRARARRRSPLLLALPQAAARAHRPLPVLRRSAVAAYDGRARSGALTGRSGFGAAHSEAESSVGVSIAARIRRKEQLMALHRHRQDLDERQARGLGGRQDPHRLARHPLRQRRLRGRALLQDAAGLGLLPPRRAHAPAAATRPRSTGWIPRSTCRR